MKKSNIIVITLLLVFIAFPGRALGFWVWTPETGEFVNPKWAVKETPQEQLEYALEFLESEEYKEAITEFRKLIKHYPRSRQAPEAQFYLGKVKEIQGVYHEAFKEYQKVIEKYPFSERSKEIVSLQYQLGENILEGHADKNPILAQISGADYDVVEIFRTVIKNAPYSELAPKSQYKIGLYLMEKKLYNEARDEFEQLINDYPESEWTKAAKYQIALADAERSGGPAYDQKITQSAVEEFEEFVEQYPDAQLSDKAKKQISNLRDKEAENNFHIAEFYEKQKNYKAAKIYYQIVVDNHATSPWAQKALNKIRELSPKIK